MVEFMISVEVLEAKYHPEVLLKSCHTEGRLCLKYGSSQAHVVCIPMYIYVEVTRRET